LPRRELEGWRSLQGRGADGAIDSDERVQAARAVVEQSERGARRLGERYWLEVTRASRGVVRGRETAQGVELRLLGRGPCLLTFGPAETTFDTNRVCSRYAIRGGALARRAGGALTLSQAGRDEPELRAAVSGFAPRLRGALYEQVQRRLHLAISRRYFRGLIDEAPA
jgi:hypothetical protein